MLLGHSVIAIRVQTNEELWAFVGNAPTRILWIPESQWPLRPYKKGSVRLEDFSLLNSCSGRGLQCTREKESSSAVHEDCGMNALNTKLRGGKNFMYRKQKTNKRGSHDGDELRRGCSNFATPDWLRTRESPRFLKKLRSSMYLYRASALSIDGRDFYVRTCRWEIPVVPRGVPMALGNVAQRGGRRRSEAICSVLDVTGFLWNCVHMRGCPLSSWWVCVRHRIASPKTLSDSCSHEELEAPTSVSTSSDPTLRDKTIRLLGRAPGGASPRHVVPSPGIVVESRRRQRRRPLLENVSRSLDCKTMTSWMSLNIHNCFRKHCYGVVLDTARCISYLSSWRVMQ